MEKGANLHANSVDRLGEVQWTQQGEEENASNGKMMGVNRLEDEEEEVKEENILVVKMSLTADVQATAMGQCLSQFDDVLVA